MSDLIDAAFLEETLGLSPLPEEGGFFHETYRADLRLSGECLAGRYAGERSAGTAIYYLLTPGSFSAMHRLRSDEVFHFYLGDPVYMLQLHPSGAVHEAAIGTDIRAGQRPQVVVPAGTWQGAALEAGGRFALLGTTMTPGFEFDDFELGWRSDLLDRYPAAAAGIERLTRH